MCRRVAHGAPHALGRKARLLRHRGRGPLRLQASRHISSRRALPVSVHRAVGPSGGRSTVQAVGRTVRGVGSSGGVGLGPSVHRSFGRPTARPGGRLGSLTSGRSARWSVERSVPRSAGHRRSVGRAGGLPEVGRSVGRSLGQGAPPVGRSGGAFVGRSSGRSSGRSGVGSVCGDVVRVHRCRGVGVWFGYTSPWEAPRHALLVRRGGKLCRGPCAAGSEISAPSPRVFGTKLGWNRPRSMKLAERRTYWEDFTPSVEQDVAIFGRTRPATWPSLRHTPVLVDM